jgi:hypothetical protein
VAVFSHKVINFKFRLLNTQTNKIIEKSILHYNENKARDLIDRLIYTANTVIGSLSKHKLINKYEYRENKITDNDDKISSYSFKSRNEEVSR